ncbi:MAG: DUF3572 domain-containing protein [Pseudomonadota bacterium]
MTQPLPRDAAEALAAKVLGWLAEDADRIGRFAGMAGADPSDFRNLAAEPEFLGFVIDFILTDETLLIDCCTDLRVPPDHPMRARAALPGGDLPNWT